MISIAINDTPCYPCRTQDDLFHKIGFLKTSEKMAHMLKQHPHTVLIELSEQHDCEHLLNTLHQHIESHHHCRVIAHHDHSKQGATRRSLHPIYHNHETTHFVVTEVPHSKLADFTQSITAHSGHPAVGKAIHQAIDGWFEVAELSKRKAKAVS